MPTENRSSNTDPRDVFIRLNPLGLGEAELRKDSTGFEDPRTHSDYLLFLAGYRETHPEPQPHPEPIAWMVGTAFWWTKEEAERDADETGKTITPIGPMTGNGYRAWQHQGEPVVLPPRREWNGLGNAADNLKAAGWNACLMAVEKLGPLYTHADPGEVERLRNDHTEAVKVGMRYQDQCKALRAQLVERDALLQRMKALFRTDDPFDLYDAVCSALSASAEPEAT